MEISVIRIKSINWITCSSSYGSGWKNSSDITKCYRLAYKVCPDGYSQSGSVCIKTSGYLGGDYKYAQWAIIRSQDVGNSSQNKSEYFTGTATSENKAIALVQLLRDYYNGTHAMIGSVSGRDAAYAKAGAAFVVNTLFGRQGGAEASRTISPEEFDKLEKVLRAIAIEGRIEWNNNFTISNTFNTYMAKFSTSSGSQYDIEAFQENIYNRSGMQIKSKDGAVIYRLLYACANPLGSGVGLINEGDYDLIPSIGINPSSIVEVSSQVVVSPEVNNIGDIGSSFTPWQISRFMLAPGASVPSGSVDTSSSPQSFFGNGLTSLLSDNSSFLQGITTMNNLNDVIPNIALGSKVCYTLSLQGHATGTSYWRHSDPNCVLVGAKPKVEIWGSDLFAGKRFIGLTGSAPLADIQTGTTVKDVGGAEKIFGSWVEYGAIASGSISGIGSGSAFADPSGLANSSSAQCDSSLLSFANSFDASCNTSSQLGGYSTEQSIPDVSASFPLDAATSLGVNPDIDLSNDSPDDVLRGVYTATGNVTITGGGGSIGAGRWFVLNAPTATVTINGNIAYTNGPLTSIQDIPQVVIIARNINITGAVTNVDSWLVARGTDVNTDGEINTCSDVAKTADLSSGICNNTLLVNGPAMANKLYLRRTAGTTSSNPAERFNLRADAYLWASIQSVGLNRAYSVYSTGVPPRL